MDEFFLFALRASIETFIIPRSEGPLPIFERMQRRLNNR